VISEIEHIVNQIRPLLAGRGPNIQGAVLVDLLATFLAGHRPDLRDEMLAIHIKYVRELIPVCEAEIFATRERPKDWP
jgi:hypothetical protein